MSVCDDTGLDARTCGHCLGITHPNLDTARVVDPAPTPPHIIRETPRRTQRTQLSHLGRMLMDTARLYADLGEALSGTRTGDSGERVAGGGTEAPLPVQQQVVDHRHLLVRGLRYWCTRATPRVELSRLVTVPAMVAHLIGYLPEMSAGDQATLHENLRDWRTGASKPVDLPKLRGKVPVGTCPNTNEHWTCGGTLWALLPADKAQTPRLSCRDCGGRWDITELPDAGTIPLPLAHAAELLHIPLGTLKSWVHYGNLEPVGREPIRVLLRDCLTVAAQ